MSAAAYPMPPTLAVCNNRGATVHSLQYDRLNTPDAPRYPPGAVALLA
jgi:hypothetical protein